MVIPSHTDIEQNWCSWRMQLWSDFPSEVPAKVPERAGREGDLTFFAVVLARSNTFWGCRFDLFCQSTQHVK